MTQDPRRDDVDGTLDCDFCGETVQPITKVVDIAFVGSTNVDFCPSCDRPVSDDWSLSESEIEDATVSQDPENDGWLDYPGKGVTGGDSDS